MQITVKRSPADSQGPDIVDSLLLTRMVGVARGRREIDYDSTHRDLPACQCPKHDRYPTGSLMRVTEAYGMWSGLNRYWSRTLTIDTDARFTSDVRLTIEREAK